MKFKFGPKANISKLPKNSGIYALSNKKEILYIGKASNLRERIRNHFLRSTYKDNLFVNQIKKIGCIETNSEIEALLLESKAIKEYMPKHNVIWKDDKNYFYVAIVKDKLPKVLITHQPHDTFIGPFVDGKALKHVLKILRKAFPYYTARKHPDKMCLWCHLKLCPGPNPDLKEYRKNIKNIVSFLKGEKQSVFKNLKKEMFLSSKNQDYEKAAKLRDQISSLENIISHAKIFKYTAKENSESILRTEAFDISNIQGKEATGSMVVLKNGYPDKSQYRKFKIRLPSKPNDTAMIKEIILRRLNHPEWPYPNLILIDGGKAQLNAALSIVKSKIKNAKCNMQIMAIAKKHNELFIENQKKPVLLENLPRQTANLILRARDEAHRFAISYHHKLRRKALIQK